MVSERYLSYCYHCGKEIRYGRIFCDECNTPINRQIFEFFIELPKNKDGVYIRPRGKKFYDVIKLYLAARLGLSDKKRIILKSATGAGKSVLLDMLAFIEVTHFPNSLTVIGSISEPVAKKHIEEIRRWISNSVFRRYIESKYEATASKTEIKLAKFDSKIISMPQSPKTRTGWHASLLLIDEIGRLTPEAYYASFSQMATQGGVEVAASTPYLNSTVMLNVWNADDVVRISLEPHECFWIPKSVFEKKREEYKRSGMEELYEQLYEAKFRSVTNRVIPDDLLLDAIKRNEHLPNSGNLVMGIDFGRSIDPTAVVVIDMETGDVKYTATFSDDWQIQFAKIRELYRQFKPVRIVADKSGIGDVIISDLRDLPIIGVSIHNDILKKQLIDKLVLAFYNRKINIVADEFPRLMQELGSFVYYDSEHKKMGPAEGRGRDDLCDALALALQAMDVSSINERQPDGNLWSFTRVDDRSEDFGWSVTKV